MIFNLDLQKEAQGWALVIGVYFYTFICHVLIPVEETDGYVLDPNSLKVKKYRMNGFQCLVVVILTAYALFIHDIAYISIIYWPAARASFALGILFSVYLYKRGKVQQEKGLVDMNTCCPVVILGPLTSKSKAHAEKRSRSSSKDRSRARSSSKSRKVRTKEQDKDSNGGVENSVEFLGRGLWDHFYCGLEVCQYVQSHVTCSSM